jgi:hypothetical protein
VPRIHRTDIRTHIEERIMSHHTTQNTHRLTPFRAFVVSSALASASLSATASAQTALGAPFIRSNQLAVYAAELSRSGDAGTTTVFGAQYGHQFHRNTSRNLISLMGRFSARSLDDSKSGALDVAARVAVSREDVLVRGVSLSAAAGYEAMAWGSDITNTARAQHKFPGSVGLAYDVHMGAATLSPFVSATTERYDRRIYLDDERLSTTRGWDGYYARGVSLRVHDAIFAASSIRGEDGTPDRHRWTLSAGISF